jgi:hypothetical protein
LQDDAALRGYDHSEIELADDPPLGIRTRGEYLDRHRLIIGLDATDSIGRRRSPHLLLKQRKALFSEQVLACGVVPVGHKHDLEHRCAVTFDAHLRIPPGVEARATVEMLLSDIHAAGITDACVDYGDLAVIAV